MSHKIAYSVILLIMIASPLGLFTQQAFAITATGGTITTSGPYTIHTFTSSGFFCVSSGSGNVQALVVASGGGGGSGTGADYGSGGGGSGGINYTTTWGVHVGCYTVTVGAGGTGGVNADGGDGNLSRFANMTASGGGGGDGGVSSGGRNGASGGGSKQSTAAGTGIAGQGNNGGGSSSGGFYGGGGGGGKDAVGGTGNNTNGGRGGNGGSYDISGSAVTYGGGGGGATQTGGTAGPGGVGGGGAGGVMANPGTAGTANTGGGGGASVNGGGGNGGSGIVIVRYVTPGPPDAVNTLQVTDSTTTTATLEWTAPDLKGGTLSGYRINYTTPWGNPATIAADTATSSTSYIVSGLTPTTQYSFRVSATTDFGRNITGANIANMTTPTFNQANFTVGDLSFDADNQDVIPIFFERDDITATSLYLNVTYPDTWELACDFHYKFAMINHTYSNLTFTTISADSVESSFLFSNVNREIINVFCWDQNGTGEGKYLITQSVFPLLTYIQKFDSGHYGTAGNFGSIDLVYLAVVIVSMVGLNRTNESVGAGFMIVITAAMAYFEFITIPTAAISGIGLVVMLIIISTRKD